MRGFAGFFTFPDPSPDAATLLARLTPADTLILAGGRAGLAGPGLARSDDGRLTVAFDGTIHDRAEPRTEDDAARCLALYQQHGAACVERLRGPFALAVWDERDGTGLLARDPLGLRAVYYFQEETTGRLLFATGVRPLAASGVVPRQLDARGLYGFFRHGAVPGSVSMVAGVRALEAGERLAWQAGRVTSERSRPRERVPYPKTDQEYTAALRAALLDSVDQHLADNAAAGVFVGGGMGSAALLALAREAGREKNLRALTIGFDDAADDETDLAQRTAAHFGVPHTHLRLDRKRARAWFDDYLPALDQPGVHGFPMFALCRFAREERIGVALAGVGLAELFGDCVLHARLKRMTTGNPRPGWMESWFGRAFQVKTPMLADFLSRPPTLSGAYAALRGVHTAEEARALVARFADPTGCADPATEDGPAANDFPTPDDEINALEYRRLLRDQLLRQADAFSRAHGLDLRLPFVDVRVAEVIAQNPATSRAWVSRLMVRLAVPEMPPWIPTKTARPGLWFPFETWQAGEWGAAKPADAAGSRQTRRTWEQKWALFLFRRWWRRMGTG